MDLLKKVLLADLAYEPKMSKIAIKLNIMFGIPRKDIKFIYVKKTDTEGFIFRYQDNCYCAFSGTESKKDLWIDLKFIRSDYYNGHLHSGFNKCIKLLTNDIMKATKELFPDSKPKGIYSFGHSLGGAISMGAADIIKIFIYPIVYSEIRTWGCPNGWSKSARKGFEKRHDVIINYINRWDIVTKLLGLSTGRPGIDIKLKGKYGHSLYKYIHNMKGSLWLKN